MILEKYDVNSIGRHLKELRLHILEKTKGDIEITVIVEKRLSASFKQIAIISSEEERATQIITKVYKAITGDAPHILSDKLLSQAADEMLKDMPENIFKKLKDLSGEKPTKDLLKEILTTLNSKDFV